MPLIHESFMIVFQVYKADWNIIKTVYLICRFMVLLLWPSVVYMFVSDHDGDDCSPWVYPQSVVYTVLASGTLFIF